MVISLRCACCPTNSPKLLLCQFFLETLIRKKQQIIAFEDVVTTVCLVNYLDDQLNHKIF